MRSYFRNLLAALRGRRGQSTITSVVTSIQSSIDTLNVARGQLYAERDANDDQIDALIMRNHDLYADADRARRLEQKLREFIA